MKSILLDFGSLNLPQCPLIKHRTIKCRRPGFKSLSLAFEDRYRVAFSGSLDAGIASIYTPGAVCRIPSSTECRIRRDVNLNRIETSDESFPKQVR